MTRVVKVELQDIEHPVLREAAAIMRSGGLVVFPTETVYGLGTIASNEQAVLSIYTAKHRQTDTPLPVQIAGIEMLSIVSSFKFKDLENIQQVKHSPNPTEIAYILANRFWPGPLTMVIPRNPSISDAVTAGNPTVGVRIPDHAIVLQILKHLKAPAVATSANVSGCPAPVTANEAAEQIGDCVELIIDSGRCIIGTSSTVISITCNGIELLRQGTITLEEIQCALQYFNGGYYE